MSRFKQEDAAKIAALSFRRGRGGLKKPLDGKDALLLQALQSAERPMTLNWTKGKETLRHIIRSVRRLKNMKNFTSISTWL